MSNTSIVERPDYYSYAITERDPNKRQTKRRRKTRWQPPDPNFASSLSAVPKFLPTGLTVEQQECLAVRIRIEELTRKILTGDVDMEFFKERQASPEPVYDNAGKRINTKDQRAKDKLMDERQVLVEIGMCITPNFKPPSDYSPAQMMKQKKLYIPVDKYPDFNFFGLIIGPRGNSQKRMEQETGCKIIIRGKGSVIEGKAKREFKGFNSADDDRLHVLISAETEQQLEKGVKMIQELLKPLGDEANRIKQQQLTELAKINGTWRENGVYEETIRTNSNIRCEVCGDASHPTVDCTYKGVPLPPARREALASEYDKFLSEISGLDGKADIYEDYLASVVDTNAQIATAPWMQR